MNVSTNSNCFQDKVNNTTAKSKVSLMGTTIDVYKFIEKDPDHTFSGWKERLLKHNDTQLPQHSTKEQVK